MRDASLVRVDLDALHAAADEPRGQRVPKLVKKDREELQRQQHARSPEQQARDDVEKVVHEEDRLRLGAAERAARVGQVLHQTEATSRCQRVVAALGRAAAEFLGRRRQQQENAEPRPPQRRHGACGNPGWARASRASRL